MGDDSPFVQITSREIWQTVSALAEDRPPAPDLERLALAVAGGELDPGNEGMARPRVS